MAPTTIDPLDFVALERAARDRTLHLVLEAWAPRLPESDSAPDSRARRAVLRAVRLDLALFVHDPELLFPCLYNRLAWIEDPAATPLLRDRLDAWWADRRGTGTSWARSLRPPEHGLDSAVLEEYREDLPNLPLRFSADSSAVGFIAPPPGPTSSPSPGPQNTPPPVARSLAWDRRTGRILDPAEIARLFPPAPARRFEMERADWGRLHVRDLTGGPDIRLRVDEDSSFGSLAELPDGSLVAAGWKGDYEGVVFRVDPPYKAVRWYAELPDWIERIVASPSGRLLAATGGRQTALLDAATGRTERRVPASHPWLSPDERTLASIESDLLRLWDISAPPLAAPRGTPAAACGFVDVQFSPDGRRLLTGELLCDARDGRQIARLSLDGPGYLEGGPPEHGRILADDRFVEMAPMRGVYTWETEEGRPILRDSSRRYGLSDKIALSPDSRLYTHFRDRHSGPKTSTLTLLRTDDGEPVATLPIKEPALVRFSPDGARVFAGSRRGELHAWSTAEGREIFHVSAHEGEISEIVVSWSGDKLVSAGQDACLRLWTTTGQLLAERALQGRYLRAFTDSGHEHRAPWRATDEALETIHGWLGFSAFPHDSMVRRRHGLVEIVDRRTGDLRARVVTHRPLRSDPTGRCFAFRDVHVTLEDA